MANQDDFETLNELYKEYADKLKNAENLQREVNTKCQHDNKNIPAIDLNS